MDLSNNGLTSAIGCQPAHNFQYVRNGVRDRCFGFGPYQKNETLPACYGSHGFDR